MSQGVGERPGLREEEVCSRGQVQDRGGLRPRQQGGCWTFCGLSFDILLLKSCINTKHKPVSIAGYQEAVRNQGDALLPGKWRPQDEAFDNPEREQRNRSGGHLHQPL